MTNILLWGLLIASFLTAMCAVVIQSHRSPELDEAVKQSMAQRSQPVRRAAMLFVALGMVSIVMWTWMALDVGDWRFAAIAWLPFTAGWLSRVNHRNH